MSAHSDPVQHDWQILSKKFGKSPYFTFAPVAEDGIAGLSFKSSPSRIAIFACAFLILGLAAIILPLHLGVQSVVLYVLISVGALFFLIGLLIPLRSREILFDRRAEQALISYGLYPFTRQLRLTTRDLQVRLSVNTANTAGLRPGMTCLNLSLPDPAHRKICLRTAQNRSKLLSDYQQLSQLLGGQALDDSIVLITLPSGSQIEVSKVPILNTSPSGFRAARLVFRTANIAMVAPTILTRLFFFIFFAVGSAALVISIGSFFGMDDPFSIIMGIAVGGIFVAVGLLGITGRLGMKPMVFDRQQDRMFKKGQKPDVFSGAVGVSLADIAAVQICSHYESDSDGPGGTVSYQFNIVLADPPGQRINLMDHGLQASLTDDAQRLAKFLNVPLLDHT